METEATGKKPTEEPGTPWESKWNDFKESIASAAKEIVEPVKEALKPWEQVWGSRQAPAQKAPVAVPDKFETVFSRLVSTESSGKHSDAPGHLVTSPKGAEGITQVMPLTGKNPGYGVEPIKSKTEEEYKRFGRDYLKAMLKEFDGDYEKALASYNFGVGKVKKAIESKGTDWKEELPKETSRYLEAILGIKSAKASESDFPGMIVKGNINLNNRPVVTNKDGTISTVRSMGVNIDGQEVLIPTVSSDGKRILSDREAIEQYKRTGKHLGKFKNAESSNTYAEKLHVEQERLYAKKR